MSFDVVGDVIPNVAVLQILMFGNTQVRKYIKVLTQGFFFDSSGYITLTASAPSCQGLPARLMNHSNLERSEASKNRSLFHDWIKMSR